jgi:putative glutamine amidotransferase
MATNTPPVIGISTDLSPSGAAAGQREPVYFLAQRYVRAVVSAGAIPVILPPAPSGGALRRLIDSLDGVILSGGNFDIHPRFYREKPLAALGIIQTERTDFELELAREALRRDLPLLGICGGIQAINVVLGGSLYQDIASQVPAADEHQQSRKKVICGHAVEIADGTRLRAIVKRRRTEVNTTHHQAIKNLGRGLIVNAQADDGIVEGIESKRHSFVVGVQWHPEVLAPKRADQRRIFQALVASCKRRGKLASAAS